MDILRFLKAYDLALDMPLMFNQASIQTQDSS